MKNIIIDCITVESGLPNWNKLIFLSIIIRKLEEKWVVQSDL